MIHPKYGIESEDEHGVWRPRESTRTQRFGMIRDLSVNRVLYYVGEVNLPGELTQSSISFSLSSCTADPSPETRPGEEDRSLIAPLLCCRWARSLPTRLIVSRDPTSPAEDTRTVKRAEEGAIAEMIVTDMVGKSERGRILGQMVSCVIPPPASTLPTFQPLG